MRSSLLILALLVAACLAHGAEPAAPRRSLTVDLFPAGPRSDWDWCWESLVTLGLCKPDLLASYFTGRPVPRACCRAADEAGYHCGPFTRTFVGSLLLPRGPLAQCARTVVTGGAATPTLQTGPRVSGGARPPPAPEVRTSARSPPPPRAPTGASSGTPKRKPDMSPRLPAPRAPRVPSGTHGSPERPPLPSVRIPPYMLVPPKVPSGTQGVRGSPGPKPQTGAPSPKAARDTRAPDVSGGARDESPPKPKIISAGSAGGRSRRAPDAYGADAGAPLAAAAAPPPQKGARTARPNAKGLPYGPPA